MKKSAFISDLLFSFFLVFTFVVCLFRYSRFSLWAAAIFAVIAGVAVTFFVWANLHRKRKIFFLKKAEEREKEKLLLHLALLPFDRQTELFSRAVKNGDSISGNPVNGDKTFARFLFTPISASDIGSFIKTEFSAANSAAPNGETEADRAGLTVYCNDADESAKSLCRRFRVTLCAGEESYLFLKSQNALPEKYLGEESFAKRKKRRFSFYFQKKNSRRFLIGGILVLCTSLITPFPYYYLISGSAMLIVAAVIRIFGKNDGV
ncbi:MAG: hypothetical protein IJB97_11015 [Clostridia bacterium]|nr:hypothetical protein [Clostridia bacterium]